MEIQVELIVTMSNNYIFKVSSISLETERGNSTHYQLSQPQPQHNATQHQHSCGVGHENDFANPTPLFKLG